MDIRELAQKNADTLRQIIGPKLTCPMCGNRDFVVLGGYVRNDVQTELGSFVIGSTDGLNVAPVICQNCGFVSFHDLAVLERVQRNEDLQTY